MRQSGCQQPLHLTTSLYTNLSYYQLLLHIRSVLVKLWDLPIYIKSVLHACNGLHQCIHYWKAFTPHFTHNRLKQMLSHIEESLPTTMHIPVSSEDTLHFYRYLHTHILIANRQFCLLIDVPIQVWTQQIIIYRIFTLDIHHGNFTACYEIDTKYLGITQDETMTVEISDNQYNTF